MSKPARKRSGNCLRQRRQNVNGEGFPMAANAKKVIQELSVAFRLAAMNEKARNGA